ncbi:MAG: alpha-amylase family glycosyl hydrolase [Gemmatimonadaceae bacterium]|jgi:cyclomaltodextrinase
MPHLRGFLLVALWAAVAAPTATPCVLAAQPAGRDVSGLAARPSPDWLKDGVVYEVYPRTFSRRGDFQGVIHGLPRLRQLGVTVLWLMPIHPIGDVKRKGALGSPYAVKDYYDVNPAYGTKADFKRLVTEAHRLGLKVIIDEVPNHTAFDNPMTKRPGLHVRDAKGQVLSPYDWTDVAALDYNSPALRAYMTDVFRHWIREYDIDGYRMDVAWNVPVDFWEALRPQLEAVKRDIVMLAEAHQPDLLRQAFDIDYSWPLYHATAAVVQEGKSATVVRDEWQKERATYPRDALHLRLPDSHDEKRAIIRFGERGALAVTALMFTLDGVPLLYNGNEVGDATESGDPALFEDMPVFWAGTKRVPQFAAFFTDMLPLRAQSSALRRGRLTWIGNSDPDRIVTFVRRSEDEELVVAINLSSRRFDGTLEASGSFVEVGLGRTTAGNAVALPAVSLEAWGYRIFRRVTPR